MKLNIFLVNQNPGEFTPDKISLSVAATLSTNEGWYIYFVLRIKITSWA